MKVRLLLLFVICCGLASLYGCKQCRKSNATFNVSQMDPSILPGVDFFAYANGNWIKNTTIPEDKGRYGSFDQLQEENNIHIKSIFEKGANKDWPKGSPWQKIGDFYKSGMDTVNIELKGLAPIQQELDEIQAITNVKQIPAIIAKLHTIRAFPLFAINANPDRKNTNQVVLNIYQGGLGLPDRDYYLSPDERSQVIRDEYFIHLSKVFILLGSSELEANNLARITLDFETRLAKVSLTRLERRNPNKTYNKVSFQEIQKISSQFNWQMYFDGIGIDVPSEMVIDNPIFYTEISQMLNDTDILTWRTYLTWNLVNRYSPYLSSGFVDQQFNFYGSKLSGNIKNKPRWERVAQSANMTIGEVVGQAFVEEMFPPEAKTKMLELVTNLKQTFAERISNLMWMSEQTKSRAIDKLNAMNVKVGYPDKWKDYSALDIDASCYATNVKRAMTFNFTENIKKLGKPVDKTEWFMTPQTVNAYYSPTLNEIVFPAAILQPPFFSIHADDALNYGAIGVVIGHEITHGFDDQGRLYNKDGNLEDWWEPADSEKFNELTQTLIDQYNAFVAINDMKLDGKLTLGENIADYGGLTISYHALQKALNTKKRPEKIDGFTPEQRFFLSYANVWKQVIRDKELMRRVKEDVHSPGRFRVNGALFNIPEFYDAFDIKETDPLYRSPEQRPQIW